VTVTSLDQASLLLRSRAGLKPEPASQARLGRLLQESASLAGIPVEAYVSMVDTQPAAFNDLLDRVTVQHSAFFRDPAQFVALAELARQRTDSHQHTVWSAGCGNGQEPYSLAMLLDETGRRNWQVVATDVSFKALAQAREGPLHRARDRGIVGRAQAALSEASPRRLRGCSINSTQRSHCAPQPCTSRCQLDGA